MCEWKKLEMTIFCKIVVADSVYDEFASVVGPYITYIDDKLFTVYSYIWWQFPHLYDQWNINEWMNEWMNVKINGM